MSLIDLITLHDVLVWILIVSLVGFIAMGLDKALAKSNWGDRISERTLWLTALAGGFAGIIAGGVTFHHKISKGEFWPPVVLAVILWVALVGLVLTGSLGI